MANTKRCSTSPIIREMEIKISVSPHTCQGSYFKKDETTGIGASIGERKPLFTIGRTVITSAVWKTVQKFLRNNKNRTTKGLSNLSSGDIPDGNERPVYVYIYLSYALILPSYLILLALNRLVLIMMECFPPTKLALGGRGSILFISVSHALYNVWYNAVTSQTFILKMKIEQSHLITKVIYCMRAAKIFFTPISFKN